MQWSDDQIELIFVELSLTAFQLKIWYFVVIAQIQCPQNVVFACEKNHKVQAARS